MTNKSILFLLTLLCISCQSNTPTSDSAVSQYVDPLIGTGGEGHTYPGSTLPFGMVQVGPHNKHRGWKWCSGYHYTDTIMQGFSHTHLSGTGLTGMGDIAVAPTSGKLQLLPGTDENPDIGYSSRWSHKTETAIPGYYAVTLEDDDIDAEMTASNRVGFHRFTFNQADDHQIILDPTANIGEHVRDTEVEILSNTEIRGFKHTKGAGGDRHVYFYAKFSKPFTKAGVAIDGKPVDGQKAAALKTAAYAQFGNNKGETVDVKIALSFVDYAGAKKNYVAEAEKISFDQQVQTAKDIWEHELGKIEVEGGSKTEKRIFYSAIYHSMQAPTLINDVDGRYYVEGKVYQGEGNQYSTFSTWDTFRAQHPLLTILTPKVTAEIVNSLISRQTVAKVGLPIWELCGYDNGCMPSYTPVSVVVDAVMKDIPGIDKELAYQAIQETSMMDDKISAFTKGEKLVPWIKKLNYVPAYIWESCAQTMEYAYQDWCIYQLGKALGKADTTYYKKRSRSYENLFDKSQGYIVPKDSTGRFLKLDTHDWKSVRPHYITGNIWGYTTFVPHEIERIIALKGGNLAFCNWLDEIINDTVPMRGEAHVDVSGFIGRYGHGDEPSQHIPYLYNYAGQPWKTQAFVRRVMQEFYTDKPDGLVNNDDCGQMSAWYAMGAMGFYSFCPGNNEYTLTSPLFNKITIHQDNGQDFTIERNKTNKDDIYIHSLLLNGQPSNSTIITHKMITDGLSLKYTLSNQPNKTWGVASK